MHIWFGMEVSCWICKDPVSLFLWPARKIKEFPPLGIDLVKLREIPHHAYSQLFTAFRLVQLSSFISQIKCLTNLFDDLFCKVNQVHFEYKNVQILETYINICANSIKQSEAVL